MRQVEKPQRGRDLVAVAIRSDGRRVPVRVTDDLLDDHSLAANLRRLVAAARGLWAGGRGR
ncbi:MAG: hypothetical protein H0V12_02815 [Chloroflexi bacterium]|nr:hypothetical protein [Chloroflexota bacterium]